MLEKQGFCSVSWMVEMGIEEGTSTGEGAECGEEIQCFKSEPVEFVNDSGDGSSGESESFWTFKRRRMLRSSSKMRLQDGARASKDQVYVDKCV